MSYSRTGGSFSPVTLEPSTAETQLAAEIAKQNPAAAPGLLNLYQERQKAAAGTYFDQFNQMRQLQLQNLHQQMVDNQVKAMEMGFKYPGALQLTAAAHPELFGNATPDDLSQAITTSGRSFDIANLGKVGTAAKDFTESNVQLPPSYYTNLIPNAPFTAGTPASTINTNITAQAHLAGTLAGQGMQTVPITSTKRNPNTGQYDKTEIHVPYWWTPEQKQQAIAQAQQGIDQVHAGQPSTPGAAIPDSRGQPTPGTAPTGAPMPGGNRQTGTPGTGTANPGGMVSPTTGIDYSQAGQGNPLLGDLPGAPATPTNLSANTQADTSSAPAQPSQTTTPAAPQRSSPGSAQAAPVQPPPQQLTDTPNNQIEDHSTPYGIKLQQRGIQGLRTLSPAARAEVILMRQHNGNIIPIRRIGGVEYYIGAKGNPLGRVP